MSTVSETVAPIDGAAERHHGRADFELGPRTSAGAGHPNDSVLPLVGTFRVAACGPVPLGVKITGHRHVSPALSVAGGGGEGVAGHELRVARSLDVFDRHFGMAVSVSVCSELLRQRRDREFGARAGQRRCHRASRTPSTCSSRVPPVPYSPETDAGRRELRGGPDRPALQQDRFALLPARARTRVVPSLRQSRSGTTRSTRRLSRIRCRWR